MQTSHTLPYTHHALVGTSMYPHCTGWHFFIYYTTPYHDCLPLQVFAVLLVVIAGLWCRVHLWGIIELSSTEEWDLLKTNAYVRTYIRTYICGCAEHPCVVTDVQTVLFYIRMKLVFFVCMQLVSYSYVSTL